MSASSMTSRRQSLNQIQRSRQGLQRPSVAPNTQSSTGNYGPRRTSTAIPLKHLCPNQCASHCSEAENTYHFLETRTAAIPVKSEHKAPVTVLSRKPQIARRPTSSSTSILNSAVAGLSLNDSNLEYDDDDDEFEKKAPQLTLEERQAIAQREREEKRRKYDEVRERLFGTNSATESGASSPGTTTPPVTPGQENQRNARWRGKNRQNNARGDATRDNRRGSPASTVSRNHKRLFDPVYTAKPNSNYAQRKDKQPQSNNTNPNSNNSQSDGAEDFQRAQAPIRTPRGPDGSGRGGFGFGRGAGRGRG